MTQATPILTPSGYAPAYAVGYADPFNFFVQVSEENPLPVTSSQGAALAPLAGQASGSGLVGPFAASAGRIVSVTLSGAWTGRVTLQRSTDGGATRDALRVAGEPWASYTRSGCEQAWLESEDGVQYYLDIALETGTLAYRVSQ